MTAARRAAIAVVAFAATVAVVAPARILAVETVAGKSHWNFVSAVLRALTDNGHAVTVFTPFPDGDRDNYTELDTSGAYAMKLDMDVTELRRRFAGPFSLLPVVLDMERRSCDILYGDGRMKAIAAGGALRARFDAIVVEPGLSDCLTHVAAGSGLPLIYAVPTAALLYEDRATFGHYPSPASVSSVLADHAVPATFAHRLFNAAMLLYVNTALRLRQLATVARDPRPYDAGRAPPPSVVFVNGHFAGDAPRPTPPNVVNVGGIHLRPARPLPSDILEFIDGSAHGVILFTFGSTVATSLLPANVQKTLLETLSVLPQRVLMKYESELANKPTNVMTGKWLPQRDILLHPNVRLFISHGGVSGVYEAVDAGVPVLGFPLFGDQPRNVDHLVEAGAAIAMDLFSATKDELFRNIVELVGNRSYARNAKIASDAFKDRPTSQQKSVAYWTEYVIRHDGAPHLRSPALDLTWYQYSLLDVTAVTFASAVFVLVVARRVLRAVHDNMCVSRHVRRTCHKSE